MYIYYYCYSVLVIYIVSCFLFFTQKTAYEMRISDWSSDVCSSDLPSAHLRPARSAPAADRRGGRPPASRPAPSGPARMALGSRFDYAACHEIGRASCRERVCQYV